jgi:hypothetical protein
MDKVLINTKELSTILNKSVFATIKITVIYLLSDAVDDGFFFGIR